VAVDLPADAIEVGRILDAWGIRGWFRVLPYSADAKALFSSKKWYLLPAEKGIKLFSGVKPLNLKEVKEHSNSIVACAEEVDDRDASDSLRGARIFVPKSNFPDTGKDEYYWVDLIGLDVVNRQGQCLGHVSNLSSTGLQTALVVDDVQASKTRQFMIPFVAIYIDEVKLSKHQVLVDWQADY
jgi:16S rRNA processing protein RimM